MFGTQFHPEKSQTLGLSADREFPGVDAVILFPAIDLKDGQCVRLKLGDMDAGDGVQRRSRRAGADLRGPGLRVSARRRSQRRLCRREPSTAPPSKRSCAAVTMPGAARRRHPHARPYRELAGKGLRRVILGTVAVRDPALVREAAREAFPGQIAVGIDARGGKVAVEGWAETSASSTPSNWPSASRAPASPPSSTPTSTATACCRASTGPSTLELAEAVDDPGHRLGRPRLDGRHPRLTEPNTASSKAPSPAARSTTAALIHVKRWRCSRQRRRRDGPALQRAANRPLLVSRVQLLWYALALVAILALGWLALSNLIPGIFLPLVLFAFIFWAVRAS